MKKNVSLLFLLVLAAALASGQELGAIKGTVMIADGTPLPGVTVTLTGSKTALRTVITSAGGNFRFLNLPVANDYTVKFELNGFRTVVREKQVVNYSEDVVLDITMEPAVLNESVVVVGQTPVIDTKKTQIGFNFTADKITSLPTSRNPWMLLTLVPGMMVDREDVGGNESGFQSNFYGHGSSFADTTWNIDGASVTDMAALGYATIYPSLDNYEEMQVNYGNNDIKSQTGGVQLNFITKRGGNKFSGTFYLDAENKEWQSKNIPADLLDAGYRGAGVNKIYLYGANLGGPIIKDRLWFFGSWGLQDISALTLAGTTDSTWMREAIARLDFQLSQNTRLSGLLITQDYQKAGLANWGPTFQAPATLWNQTGPQYILKGEIEQMSGNLFLNAKLIYEYLSFENLPVQGKRTADGSGPYMWISYDPTFYVSGNIFDVGTTRPFFNLNLNGDYFAEKVLGADHEIKFGVDYLKASTTTFDVYEDNLYIIEESPDLRFAALVRDLRYSEGLTRFAAYLQDTMTFGRLAVKLGLRYDIERSTVRASNVPASPWLPQYLSALSVKDIVPGVSWKVLSPRLSLIYDIFGNGKDVLKFSFARYGSPAGYSVADFINPIGFANWPEIGLLWIDANEDRRVTSPELFGVDPGTGDLKDPNDPAYWLWFSGFDPAHPTNTDPRNKLDPNFNSPILSELSLSYEKEILPDFAARLELFYKKQTRLVWDKGIMADGSIETSKNWFVAGRDPTVNADYYGRVEWPVATYRTFHEKQYNQYLAGGIVLTKRLSNKWMLDGSLTLTNWTFHPNGDYDFNPNNRNFWDGGVVAPQTTAGGGYSDVYVNARWMAKLSGLYQFPFGINAGFTFVARDGYVMPYYIRVPEVPNVGTVTLFAHKDGSPAKFGDDRLSAFSMLNLRVEKTFAVAENSTVVISADAFNAFNSAVVLAVDNYLTSPTRDMSRRILNPRVFKFGIRYSF